MAETKFEPVKLVAVDRGFRGGELVERGEKFMFTPTKMGKDGKPRLPKWAQPADQPLPKKDSRTAGDLKPTAAQAAVATKRGALAGEAKTEPLA